MTDLFNDTTTPTNYIEELVGENKKFKTVDDLAKGKYEADLYIKDLERQKDELRTDYLKLREDSMARAKLEEMIDKISAQRTSSEAPTAKESEKPAFDMSNIDEILERKLKEKELSRSKDQNTKMITDALKERYGQSYMDVLQKQTEELGLSKEAVNYLAETSPRALMKQLGLDEAPRTDPFRTPPRNSPFLSPKGEQKRTWSYYKKLKDENPTLYLNPKTQVQMHKDYQAYGRDFEDGDFLAYGQQSIADL
jgi:hypothetical protein